MENETKIYADKRCIQTKKSGHLSKTGKIMEKEYSNGEITIKWQPQICQHVGVCIKMLPRVYNPKKRPWIAIENASTEELKNQVNKCPSGALSYHVK